MENNFGAWTAQPVEGYEKNRILGGGFKYFLFSTLLGEMIKFDDHIFRMGWNHQLEFVYTQLSRWPLKEDAWKTFLFFWDDNFSGALEVC